MQPKDVENLEDLIREEYGNLYAIFEDAVSGDGVAGMVKAGIPQNVAEAIDQIAHENVKGPSVDIAGYVDLLCPAPNGVEVLKKALKAASAVESGEGTTVEISYVGAPRYRVRVIAPDYKKAENVLKNAAKTAIDYVKKHEGEGEFHRHMEEAKSFS